MGPGAPGAGPARIDSPRMLPSGPDRTRAQRSGFKTASSGSGQVEPPGDASFQETGVGPIDIDNRASIGNARASDSAGALPLHARKACSTELPLEGNRETKKILTRVPFLPAGAEAMTTCILRGPGAGTATAGKATPSQAPREVWASCPPDRSQAPGYRFDDPLPSRHGNRALERTRTTEGCRRSKPPLEREAYVRAYMKYLGREWIRPDHL